MRQKGAWYMLKREARARSIYWENNGIAHRIQGKSKPWKHQRCCWAQELPELPGNRRVSGFSLSLAKVPFSHLFHCSFSLYKPVGSISWPKIDHWEAPWLIDIWNLRLQECQNSPSKIQNLKEGIQWPSLDRSFPSFWPAGLRPCVHDLFPLFQLSKLISDFFPDTTWEP